MGTIKDEKHVNTLAIDSEESSQVHDWSSQEEKKLVRRIDMTLMPLLIIGFAVLQLDRANIGNVMTDHFLKEVGMTQFQYNVGNQMMFLGIVLFEIPSNLVLYRVGPAIWIGFQIIAWGLVATLQMFIKGKGYGAFIATRFLLGVCECGYIPAGLYTITRFYKKDEISKRFAWFFLGNMVANAGSGLLAFGILRMRGIANLSGWQWVFLIEGLLTIFIAVAFVVLFPRSTSHPVSLLGLRYFNEQEAHILTQRILQDDPSKVHSHTHVSREELKAVFTNWKLIGHVMTTLGCFSALASFNAYGPTIVASYGYKSIEANAMNSIGSWILIPITILTGWIADKWGKRGPLVLGGTAVGFIFLAANKGIAESNKVQAKFAFLTIIYSFSFNWHPVNASWMALNAKTAGERSVTMSILIMAANLSGVIGGQIFQAHDAPLYKTGWSVTVALSCIGVVAAALTNFQYWYLNRRNRKLGNTEFIYHY